ncbi:MAG: FG-GAP repeat protein [Bacteroidales bacterium]
MMRKITLFISAFLLLAFNILPLGFQAQSFEEVQKLLASDGESGDQFGKSVSTSGNYSIVGATYDYHNGGYKGSAYIFHYSESTWQQQAKLTASDGVEYDEFGVSVSISGDYAIVGTFHDYNTGSICGSAYIYYNNSGIWQQQAILNASDGAPSDYFGRSVSISGNYIIVGACGDDDYGYESGSAYVFYNNAGIWEQQAKLTASDGESSEYFGLTVSISGNFAIVGAFQDDENGPISGSAYIFHNNSGIWQQQTKLTASDAAALNYFGYSVCISGNYAIVGAYGDDDNGSYSGSAYVFYNNLGIWEQQAKLTAFDGETNDYFGLSVSISGDYAIVGANGDDDNGSSSGSTYVFHNNSGTWQQLNKLTTSDGAAYDFFGKSVCISDDFAIMGAVGDDNNGSAYIFGPSQFQSDSLNLTAFLQGPYNGSEMNTDLNPEPIPLSQPYDDPLKWDYQGTESVATIPNADVVDWVLVELRETSGDASTALPDSMISQQAAFILKDGSVVGLDGASPLYFDNEISDNLYVVVYHRNHLPIMSSGPLIAAKGDYSWDFTTGVGQAYGTDALVDLGGGVYGMIGGDGNSNGQIEYYDKDSVWTAEAGNAAYLFGDFSLDKQADNIDKNDLWEPNLDVINQVPGSQCEPQPDIANAGPDTDWECDWGATLSANSPVNGNGEWTIVHGVNGFFDNINDPGTVFYGDVGNTYKLKWTISSPCASSHDFVNVEFAPDPTQAYAGPDQLDVPGTQTILEANFPTLGVGEEGYWEIITGEGGSFEDEFNPTSIFYGVPENTYELRWTIWNVCYSSEDYVNISFAESFVWEEVLNPITGRTWMDRNLGATRACVKQ